MPKLSNILGNIRTLHDRIAADVYPNGGTLTCRVCGHQQPMSTKDAAHYLAHGWPRHCGKEMRTEAALASLPTEGQG